MPFEEVDKKITGRLRKIGRKSRIRGFRPGKVPLELIKERYGRQVFGEVADSMVTDAYYTAVADHKLRPVGKPEFEDVKAIPGEDIRFAVNIEVFPDFEPKLLDGISVEVPVTTVTDKDVDDAVLQMRRNYAEWSEVERPIAENDRVVLSFESKKTSEVLLLDDENKVTFIVNNEDSEQNFSRQLIGVSQGETARIAFTAPSRGNNVLSRLFSRRKLRFTATVEKVEEASLPPLSAVPLEQYGIKEDSGEEVRSALSKIMKRQTDKAVTARTRAAIADALIANNMIELPQSLVENEMKAMQVTQQMNAKKEEDQSGEDQSGEDQSGEDQLREDALRKQAERNVRFTLILDKIAERRQLEVDPRKFEAKLDELAVLYEDSEALKRYYRTNREARRNLRAQVLQNQVFELVVKTAKLKQKNFTFKELTRL